jgi:hypothetical protein
VEKIKADQEFRFFSKSKLGNLNGRRISISPAPMPYDICWENLNFNKGDQLARKVITYLVNLLVIALSFGACCLLEKVIHVINALFNFLVCAKTFLYF